MKFTVQFLWDGDAFLIMKTLNLDHFVIYEKVVWYQYIFSCSFDSTRLDFQVA